MISLKQGIQVQAVGPNTYTAHLHSDWCIGTVPHGGYVTSVFLSVVKLHFDTVRATYHQPHTLAVQLTFLRRSSLGPATFTVTESKLGHRTSSVHVALSQGDDPRQLVVGYFTQSNINTEIGISIALPVTLHPAPSCLTSTKALREGAEPEWKLYENPFSGFRRAGQHLLTYLPRNGHTGLIDQWLTLADGERFTQESLGYVVDSFPQLVELAQTSGKLSREPERLARDGKQATTLDGEEHSRNTKSRSQWAKFWYPTVLLNMEIKKALPAEGTEWLFSRVKASQIRNGRMDIELVILDEAQEIIALSNHVALIVPAERNTVRGRNNKTDRQSTL